VLSTSTNRFLGLRVGTRTTLPLLSLMFARMTSSDSRSLVMMGGWLWEAQAETVAQMV
jgi:hypothetical protein